MESFEPLNAIIDEFQIKKGTLSIFGLDALYQRGKDFRFDDIELIDSIDPVTLTFDDDEPPFCSIFSEPDSTYTTQPTQASQIDARLHSRAPVKLVSDGEILSSEFDQERTSPVLLSEVDTQPLKRKV